MRRRVASQAVRSNNVLWSIYTAKSKVFLSLKLSCLKNATMAAISSLSSYVSCLSQQTRHTVLQLLSSLYSSTLCLFTKRGIQEFLLNMFYDDSNLCMYMKFIIDYVYRMMLDMIYLAYVLRLFMVVLFGIFVESCYGAIIWNIC